MKEFEVIKKSITVKVDQKTAYNFCIKPKNLAAMVKNFAEVTSKGKNKLHWKVGEILGMSIAWDSTITGKPYERITCKSIDENLLENEMNLIFETVATGTKITILIKHIELNALVEKGIETLTGLDTKSIVAEAVKNLKKSIQ